MAMRLLSLLLPPLVGVIVMAALVQGQSSGIVCPPEAAYLPCTCTQYIDNNNNTTLPAQQWLFLNCANQNLGDQKINAILDAFLDAAPDVTPLALVFLNKNRLTRVPTPIRSFSTQLVNVRLDLNDIASIEPGAFNFTQSSSSQNNNNVNLELNGNTLTTIAPGAFKGIAMSSSFLPSFIL